MSRKPHIFSDSDGVLFDFELGYFNAFGHHFHAVEAGVAWKNIYRMPDFYDTLPLMPGAEEYWAMIEGLDPTVLTGAPRQVTKRLVRQSVVPLLVTLVLTCR